MKTRRFIALAALPTLLSMSIASVPAYASVSNPTLQLGASGPAVLTLQTMLNEAGYTVGAGTSKFDSKTLVQVKAFQQTYHLTVDGVVGPITWSALATADAAAKATSTSTTSGSVSQSTSISNHPNADLQTAITVNGQRFVSPSGFVYNDTTYMPIWYVMQALTKINVQNTWNDSGWNLTPPSNIQVNFDTIQAGIGSKSISINGRVVTRVDGIVATDPSSGQATTFMPIWYVMQVLGRMGLNSTWNGQSWNLPNWSTTTGATGGSTGTSTGGGSGTGTNTGSTSGSGSTGTGTSTGGDTSGSGSTGTGTSTGSTSGTGTSGSGSTTGTTTPPSFTTVDLRFPAPTNINASSIDVFFSSHPSPMAGLGQSFMTAQNTYGVDVNYLVAQAILESAWGTSAISQAKNNLFGYGAYDVNPGNDAGTFPSEDYAIRFQAWMMRNSYLSTGSSLYVSPTLRGIGVHYATDTQYANSIGSIMNQFASTEGDSVNSYPQYSASVPAPSPQSTLEPIYYYNGAQATVMGSPYYNNGLPYYPDMLSGENDMFFGTLQVGSSGSNVKSLQNFLNQQVQSGLTVDGDFGPMTQNAVKQYQTQNGLAVTGVWDFSLWHLISSSNPSVIPAGTTVSIDKAMQGMANGYVTEWDHVVGFGWVDAHYVGLTNVYRAVVQNPQSTQTTIHVYSSQNPSQVLASLHSGDYIVCTNSTPVNGAYSVQIADQLSGQSMTGLIQTSEASLVQVVAPIQN